MWPLLLSTILALGLGLVAPQIPAIACGFAIIGALAWRRQEAAVTAIEERDGVAFYVEPTSPLKPIKLIRAPGFRRDMVSVNGDRALSRLRLRPRRSAVAARRACSRSPPPAPSPPPSPPRARPSPCQRLKGRDFAPARFVKLVERRSGAPRRLRRCRAGRCGASP